MNFIHPEIAEYLQALNEKDDAQLNQLREYGQKEQIPIVDQEIGKFLYLLVLLYQPKNILEIGFGGGYSTLWLMKALGEDGRITSLELNRDRITAGKKLFDDFGFLSRLDLRYEDALQFLLTTDETFDLIFLDAVKRSYMDYIDRVARVLKPRGLFIADNILFRGNVVKEDVGKKYQVGTSVIKEFNQSLANLDNFETVFLPIGDGLSFSVKIS